MSVYMIFLREGPVVDADAMKEYQAINRQNVGAFDMRPLVANGAIEAIEGKPPETAVVLEFPNEEEAKAWYNSPAYQKAIPFRHKAGEYRAFMVQGFAIPKA